MFQITDEAVLRKIEDAYNKASSGVGSWSTIYQLVYDALSVGLDVPRPGVDTAVYLWIGGALKVNSNTGSFAAYIRNYTQRQYDLRNGFHEDATSKIQNASDTIAQRFAATLLGFNLSGGGNPQNIVDAPEVITLDKIPPSLRGIVPSLEVVGGIDAAAAAAKVFNAVNSHQAVINEEGESQNFKNYTPWSGTVLFTNLGLNKFYNDWVLTKEITNYKAETGLYDLVAIAQATVELKTVFGGLKALFLESGTYFSILDLGREAVNEVEAKANTFFTDTYGAEFSGIKIGTDTFRDLDGVITSKEYYKTGSYKDDVGDTALIVGARTRVVNAGAGNDTIKIIKPTDNPLTPRVIDGGSLKVNGGSVVEHNIADYSAIKTSLTVTFEEYINFGYRIKVVYNTRPFVFTDYLYNINEIVFSSGGDSVKLDALTLRLLKEYHVKINFGGQSDDDLTTGSLPKSGAGTDTIDTSALHGTGAGNTGLVIDLNTEDNQFIANITGDIPTRLGLNGKFPTNFTEAAAVLGKVLSEVASPTDLSQYGKADRLNVKNVESAIGTDQSDLIIGADTVYTWKTPAADPNAPVGTPANTPAPKPERVVDTEFRGYDLLSGGGNDTILVANDDLCEIKITA